jgi:alginate O-acetyltransferase complex protein AlgI
MLFNSFDFAIFLVVVLAVYFALQRGGHRMLQNRFLLVMSYVFYAAWDWRFTLLIALSTVVDYQVALALSRARDPARRRVLISTSLAVNLGLLGFFKYAGFFAQSLEDLFQVFGVVIPDFALEVLLPVGISFYTFQTLSYTIDVYRGNLQPTRDFFDFALFVAFFPQLVAGPIERASTFLPQIAKPRDPSWQRFSSGAWLIYWGTFKKVVIADNLAKLVDHVYSGSAAGGGDVTGVEMWLAVYAFTWQIYCDFSGYTDIARGVARIMGFDLMLNFRLPYFATSPANFWQRWHISLSTWLRDYLFLSLGGNSRGPRRAAFNLGLTMLLGGLWHGAAWPFVLWGAFHGLLLMLHRLCLPLLTRVNPTGEAGRWLWQGVRIVVTFHFIAFGLMIFRSDSLSHIIANTAILFGPMSWSAGAGWLAPLALLLAPLALVQLAQAATGDLEVMLRWTWPVRLALYTVLALLIVLLGEDGGNPFIYFQF